jgi:hypothetical protein
MSTGQHNPRAYSNQLILLACLLAIRLGSANAVAIRFRVSELVDLGGAALRFGGAAAHPWVFASCAARRCRFETLALSARLTGEKVNSGEAD